MQSTRTLSLIAIFTSLTIASDYALAPVLNVKLMDTLVFSTSYAFGFRIGTSIAILSESSLECGLSVWIIRSNYSILSIGRVALCNSGILCLEDLGNGEIFRFVRS